jgi:hypothetical protein
MLRRIGSLVSLLVVAVLCAAIGVGSAFAQAGNDPFDRLDGNGDGVLSGTEAKTMLQYDRDGNGEISRAEYLAGTQPTKNGGGAVDQATAGARFAQIDLNQDGYLSGTELLGSEAFDTNQDGRVTKDEYVAGATAGGEASEVFVYVPQDETSFDVQPTDVVRLLGNGISGSTITAQVVGPAKLKRTAVTQFVEGGMLPIGALQKEFEVVPTGPGAVSVIITVTYPTGGDPKVTVYRFKVADEPKA